ncbi:hypothetical protein, partial [Klebsiella pneumoniae]|uniref:hypothetical protein n=3 Tax=Pseudomonadota TaxID=1224 RepID=UPI0027319656
SESLVSDGPSLLEALQRQADLWAWTSRDLARALSDLASLQFLGWTALSAAGFAAVVFKRERGG